MKCRLPWNALAHQFCLPAESRSLFRAEACDNLCAALDRYVVRGVDHNVPFLRSAHEMLTLYPRSSNIPFFNAGRVTVLTLWQRSVRSFHTHPC